MLRVLLALLVSTIASCSFASASSLPALSYDHDFPDPSVIRVQDYFYAYATQTITDRPNSKLLNIQVARSRDLKTWEHLGDALPMKPTWASGTQKFWAPHIHRNSSSYYLYYSAEPDTKDGLCLAVAVSSKPEGPFVDMGKPLQCSPGFENIDPMVFTDHASGKTLLYWGSGFGPIRMRALASNMIEFESGSTELAVLSPEKTQEGNQDADRYTPLIEGAWVHKHGRFYYLFVSGNNCCEPNPHYAVLAARSESPAGPFLWRENDSRKSIVIENNNGPYIATGHNALIPFGNTLVALYHGISPQQMFVQNQIPGDRRVRRVLLMSKIYFKDGWPVVVPETSR
jgi:arabinan endo-1,5-alpha-L-arabinosidase